MERLLRRPTLSRRWINSLTASMCPLTPLGRKAGNYFSNHTAVQMTFGLLYVHTTPSCIAYFSNQFLRELILYLDYWQKTVNDRTDCKDDDKKHMVLSSITDKGIRMTGQC